MKRILLLGLLASFVACSDDNGDDTPPDDNRVHPTSGSSWTFLIYMVADNNLEPASVSDLAEMAGAGTNGSFNILVQADRAQGYTNQGVGGLPDWESTKRLKVGAGSITELSDLGEVNMGDPKVLTDFIAWGVKQAPADRYALIFWDHGGAWPGFGGDESTANHDLLTLGELKQGISAGMQQADLKQFALIGYDACLMATYETAMTMAPFGEYMLASEELEPGHGWDYGSLKVLATTPTTGPVDLAKGIIGGFKAQAQTEGTDKAITLSLVDLYKVGALQKAIGSLASAIKGNVAKLGGAVGKERARVLGFGRDPDPQRDTHMIDLGLFAKQLGAASSELSGATGAVQSALKGAMLAVENGAATTGAEGMSIYFPTQGAYYNKSYNEVAEAAEWQQMLSAYHTAGGQVPQGQVPTFTNPNHLADVQLAGESAVVSGTLTAGTGSNVVVTTLYYGVVDAGTQSVMILGDRSGAIQGDTASSTWDGSALVLEQGGNQSYAYLGEAINGNVIKAGIPFVYQTGGGPQQFVLLVLLADAQTGNVLQSTYYLVTDAGLGELYPQPGSTMVPLAPVIDQSGQAQWLPLTQTPFDPTVAINYGFQDLPAGTDAYVSLEVMDFGGNGDYVYWNGTL